MFFLFVFICCLFSSSLVVVYSFEEELWINKKEWNHDLGYLSLEWRLRGKREPNNNHNLMYLSFGSSSYQDKLIERIRSSFNLDTMEHVTDEFRNIPHFAHKIYCVSAPVPPDDILSADKESSVELYLLELKKFINSLQSAVKLIKEEQAALEELNQFLLNSKGSNMDSNSPDLPKELRKQIIANPIRFLVIQNFNALFFKINSIESRNDISFYKELDFLFDIQKDLSPFDNMIVLLTVDEKTLSHPNSPARSPFNTGGYDIKNIPSLMVWYEKYFDRPGFASKLFVQNINRFPTENTAKTKENQPTSESVPPPAGCPADSFPATEGIPHVNQQFLQETFASIPEESSSSSSSSVGPLDQILEKRARLYRVWKEKGMAVEYDHDLLMEQRNETGSMNKDNESLFSLRSVFTIVLALVVRYLVKAWTSPVGDVSLPQQPTEPAGDQQSQQQTTSSSGAHQADLKEHSQ
jgi:hypothetical protein